MIPSEEVSVLVSAVEVRWEVVVCILHLTIRSLRDRVDEDVEGSILLMLRLVRGMMILLVLEVLPVGIREVRGWGVGRRIHLGGLGMGISFEGWSTV